MEREHKEKEVIGEEFKKRLNNTNLIIDIELDENKRLYGDDWSSFLGRTKACLGVESGVSIFDINGDIKFDYDILSMHYKLGLSDMKIAQDLIEKWEKKCL